MVDERALEISKKRGGENAESPFSVTELLEQSGEPFDHSKFRQRLREIRGGVMETGGIVFIPLVWGMPQPAENFTEDNRLPVRYTPRSLRTSYPRFNLRRDVPEVLEFGEWAFYDFTSKPDPMTEADVKARVQMVQDFEPLVFPEHRNGFFRMNGVTVITNEGGLARISLNFPDSLQPAEDSPLRVDTDLPVPYEDSFATRVFFAAVLHEMGLEADFIFHAVGTFQPQPIAGREGEYAVTDRERRVTSDLSSIPSARRRYLVFDEEMGRFVWTKQEGGPKTPEEVYRNIITAAHFEKDGNIAFEIESRPKTT